MLSKSLSTSARFAQLFEVAPDLAEFAQSLYPLLIAHADDYGREEGDPATVKRKVHPSSPRSLQSFAQVLAVMDAVGLLRWYDAKGRLVYEIAQADVHQRGLKRKTPSRFPQPVEKIAGSVEKIAAFRAAIKGIELNLDPIPTCTARTKLWKTALRRLEPIAKEILALFPRDEPHEQLRTLKLRAAKAHLRCDDTQGTLALSRARSWRDSTLKRHGG